VDQAQLQKELDRFWTAFSNNRNKIVEDQHFGETQQAGLRVIEVGALLLQIQALVNLNGTLSTIDSKLDDVRHILGGAM